MGDNTTFFGKITELIRECWESDARKKGTVFISKDRIGDLVSLGYDCVVESDNEKYSDDVVKNLGVNYVSGMINDNLGNIDLDSLKEIEVFKNIPNLGTLDKYFKVMGAEG